MTDMQDLFRQVEDVRKDAQDSLCRMLMAVAASGKVAIIPSPQYLTTSPMIVVPKEMYDRMLELSKETNHDRA